jgi:hypothetical protein
VSNSKNPEIEFLDSLPVWLRKACEEGLSNFTEAEMAEWVKNQDYACDKICEYERILRRIPAKWSEYRKRNKLEGAKAFVYFLPPNPEGRPRNEIYPNAAKLMQEGKSIGVICQKLIPEYPNATSDEKRKIRDRVAKGIAYINKSTKG